MGIKKNSKSKIEQKKFDTVKLTFTLSQAKHLVWKDKGEFQYKGKMYDVVRTIKTSDKLVFYCYQDEEESWFMKRLEKLIEQCFGSTDAEDTSVSITTFTPLFLEPFFMLYSVNNLSEFLTNIYYYIFSYNSIDLSFISPPPQVG